MLKQIIYSHRTNIKSVATIYLLFAVCFFCINQTLQAQTSDFTYQGRLASGGQPANGNYDFEFKLYDALSDGALLGSRTRLGVPVTSGVFTVRLDFPSSEFSGPDRFLQIGVKVAGSAEPFTTLNPRQPITSSPYAIRSLNADAATTATNATNATNSSQLGGVAANQYVLTTDSRMTDARSPLPNSQNYIQNMTSQQSSTNFNISGNGTVGGTLNGNIVNATTQFNIGGNRVLSNSGSDNLFAGQGSGEVNTGSINAFFGRDTGKNNTLGSSNSFFGMGAGFNNVEGGNNTFLGTSAGGNSSGSNANANTFVGANSGNGNTGGRLNTMLGSSADMPFNSSLINATAIGGRAFVTQSNSLVLGSINGVNGATSDTNVGIGTTAPTERLHVVGNGLFTGNLTISGTLNATVATANNALNLGGVAANQYVQTNDARLSDARTPLPNSPNYIQNSTTQQSSSNFNISGNGTVGGTLNGNVVNATTQFSIAGLRVLTVNAPYNDGLGAVFTASNTFAGEGAGLNTTPSPSQIFGKLNAFFGAGAGQANTTGALNSFFGFQAGFNSSTGFSNAFFGQSAGYNNTGGENSFFGRLSGYNDISGLRNTVVGSSAYFTANNTSGNDNTLLGAYSQVTANLSNQTAIGANAMVTQSNSLVLGSINTKVGIGTTAPFGKLQVVTANDTTPSNIFGWEARHFVVGGPSNTGGIGLSYDQTSQVGYIQAISPGFSWRNLVLQSGGGNVGIGTTAPSERLEVSGTGIVRARINSDSNAGIRLALNGQAKWSVATVSGGQFQIYNDAINQNAILIDATTNFVGINSLASGSTQLCRNASNQISACSSSLRYKTNIAQFGSGLSLINRLSPITFDWKDGGMKDLGLGAEDVEKIEPLLVTHNNKGEVEGVKYDRIGVVLINALKEQQKLIENQQRQIDALKKLVCAMNPTAEICKE